MKAPYTLHHLVAARGKETFGLSLWAHDIRHALIRAKKLLDASGYSVHPAPKED